MDAAADETRVSAWRGGRFVAQARPVPREAAVAVSVNGSTHAVMMATPEHLVELGVGLVLNERIVRTAGEIESVDCVETPEGFDCRVWISAERAGTYVARRRQMTGPVGCGLCGVESLELASPPLPPVASRLRLTPEAIPVAMDAMQRRQRLGRLTRAVHAAGFAHATGECLAVFEDVGRHNALDKLAGHLARGEETPTEGFLTITSRVSVELIQKCAVMGCELIAAVSVPTGLAIRQAQAVGITLVAVSRGAEFEVFTHPERFLEG